MNMTLQVEGRAELERLLATFGRRVQRRVVKQAVDRALRPMRAVARTNARGLRRGETKRYRGMSSLLARHIIIKPSRRRRPGEYTAQLMMRPKVPEFLYKAKSTGRVSYIPAAIEYGHGPDRDSAARPFLRPAAERTSGETMRVLADELRRGLLREAIRGRYG